MTLLDSLSPSEALAFAGGAAALVGWLVRQDRRIEAKSDATACAACRERVNEELAELRESQAVTGTELRAMSQKIDDIGRDLRSLAAQLQRLFERGTGS
jgi:uncharacterized protein (DUF3084 family)